MINQDTSSYININTVSTLPFPSIVTWASIVLCFQVSTGSQEQLRYIKVTSPRCSMQRLSTSDWTRNFWYKMPISDISLDTLVFLKERNFNEHLRINHGTPVSDRQSAIRWFEQVWTSSDVKQDPTSNLKRKWWPHPSNLTNQWLKYWPIIS